MRNYLSLLASTALMTAATILPCTQARADEPTTRNNQYGVFAPLTGLYLGGFGGYDSTHDNRPGSDTNPRGGDYGAFAGYSLDTLLDQTLGIGLTGSLEGSYSWSDAHDRTDGEGTGVRTAKKNDWGVDFRPGLTFIDKYAPFGLKPYGIIGYRRADYDTNEGGSSESSHFNGVAVGAGTEFLTYDHFGVRLDYDHVFYGEHDNQTPSENDVRLGVAYHF